MSELGTFSGWAGLVGLGLGRGLGAGRGGGAGWLVVWAGNEPGPGGGLGGLGWAGLGWLNRK